MSATTKHGLHPEAEILNAFAGQALAERDRGDVFAHLAVCGRCRQVVALARKAADVEAAAPAAARRAAIQPASWSKKWRLVWVPTAAVAAFAAVSIAVYVHQADRSVATFKVAEPTTAQNEPAAANPAPPKTETAPPAPHVATKAPATTSKPKLPAAPPNSSSQQVTVTAAAPPQLEAPEQVEAVPPEPAPASGAGPNGLFHRSFAPAAPAVSSAQPAVRAFREEQKRQDERILQKEEQRAKATENRAPSASPATPNPAPSTALATDGSSPGDQNAAASSSNRPTEMSAGTLSGLGSMKSMRSATRSAPSEANINLPSGLPVISSVAAGRRMLAIDKAGTLFLSEDSGNTWQRVLRQWTGHAVAIRMHSAPDANANTVTTTATATEQSEAAPGLADTPSPPASSALFEILNDKDQVWLSTDGRLWIAK